MSAQPLLKSQNAAQSSNHSNATGLLRTLVANEHIFAVVGPAGSGTSSVAEALRQLLIQYGIQAQIIKASKEIEQWAQRKGLEVQNTSPLARARALQDLGDKFREQTADNAAVAISLMRQIHQARETRVEQLSKTSATVPEPRAYILDSFKHPAETALLRQVYQDAFCQIGVVCTEDQRERRLGQEKCRDSSAQEIREFMNRDENGADKHGQKVADTFHLSDFFVDNTPPRVVSQGSGVEVENPEWDVADQLGRLIDILTHQKLVRPRSNETGMFHAYGAQMRSACLSRQVGAALVDASGNLMATGTNEVPRAGGGVYGGNFSSDTQSGKEHDHRCSVSGGYCRNTNEQRTIIQHIIETFPELKTAYDVSTLQAKLRKTEVGRLLEFSRAALRPTYCSAPLPV